MRIIGLGIVFALILNGSAFAQEWTRCMSRCQVAYDRMDPAHAFWRQALSELLETARGRIEAEWPLRDRLLGLPSDLVLHPHFDIKGDEGKSLEQFRSCVTICGKP